MARRTPPRKVTPFPLWNSIGARWSSASPMLPIRGRSAEQRRAASRAEASGRLRLRILEASDASSALRHAGVFAPTADIGRIRCAVRATACRGVIVPGPKSGKVDL